ncbi:MAG: hypothetical protein QOE90_1021 [Thermoplasmata archaeon]|jgi:hypothetical protein|nr:hypothetical protein [Thermoplasmata archaeon]
MTATRLMECARCNVLVHAAATGKSICPECRRPLAPGLRDVGFHDDPRVYGVPGEPYVPEPDSASEPRKAPKLRCADGHRVRSRPERAVDDWLHQNGILHELEPILKGMRPDWRVGSVYIEMWGLKGQQGYETRRAQKLALYRKRKLRLVELFPEDVEDLEPKLGFLRGVRAGLTRWE